MKHRTFEFYKVGFKAKDETEYTIMNDPYVNIHNALLVAEELCASRNQETIVARFQIIEKFYP